MLNLSLSYCLKSLRRIKDLFGKRLTKNCKIFDIFYDDTLNGCLKINYPDFHNFHHLDSYGVLAFHNGERSNENHGLIVSD